MRLHNAESRDSAGADLKQLCSHVVTALQLRWHDHKQFVPAKLPCCISAGIATHLQAIYQFAWIRTGHISASQKYAGAHACDQCLATSDGIRWSRYQLRPLIVEDFRTALWKSFVDELAYCKIQGRIACRAF